jgi:hypothetical protein
MNVQGTDISDFSGSVGELLAFKVAGDSVSQEPTGDFVSPVLEI